MALPEQQVESILSRRWQVLKFVSSSQSTGFFPFTDLIILGIWRSLFGPLYDWPLAVCDWKSVDHTLDLVPSDNVYTHIAAETYNVYHNPDHRWYYMDAMQPNETLVFKSFDSRHSDETARGKFVPCHIQRLQEGFLYCANYLTSMPQCRF